jgi:hypothetical protein
MLDLLEVPEQSRLVEQIIRGSQPAPVLLRDLVNGLGHGCILGETLKADFFVRWRAQSAPNARKRDYRARGLLSV